MDAIASLIIASRTSFSPLLPLIDEQLSVFAQRCKCTRATPETDDCFSIEALSGENGILTFARVADRRREWRGIARVGSTPEGNQEEMPRLIVGAAIVDSLEHPTRLLTAQRSYPEKLAGLWEFPGGKVEPGESPESALQREIREELSTVLTLGPRIDSRAGDWPLPGGNDMRLWLATAKGAPAPVLGSSHRELRWVRLEDIDSLPWLPGDLQILPALRKIVI